MDDLKNMININNNIKESYRLEKQRGLIKCEMQLPDTKKIQNGYDLFDSVLDVNQGGYSISYGDDFLFTYGIEPCCGVVLYDAQKSILFHLDGTTSPEEVKQTTDSYGFSSDAKVLICPGVTCGISGTFEYERLKKIYNDDGYDTMVCRINGTFGYIGVSGNEIRFGSAMFKENETIFARTSSHKR